MEVHSVENKTPVPAHTPAVKEHENPKLGKIKIAFLYVLIGGLVISALISVVAILIGQFNEVVIKALLTTFTFVTHSLLILALVLADRHNTIGKALFPTTLFAAIVANMITSTLGTWQVWDSEVSGRAFLLYMLVIGSSLIASGALKMRIAHRYTNIAVYTTLSLIAVLTLVLIPWVLAPDADWIGSFYYRLVSAVTILAATTLSLSVILNRIALSQKPELAKKPEQHKETPGGMLAIYIVVGTIAGFTWLYGVGSLISGASSLEREVTPYNNSTKYNKYD